MQAGEFGVYRFLFRHYAIYLEPVERGIVIGFCHSDDRREEDGLLRTPSEKSREPDLNVDVHEILRRNAPLDDNVG